MELPKCLPFYGQAWLDLKTFQIFNQQPMVHIGLQRETSKRSPLRDKIAKRKGWLSPWTRLILNRWQKYTPITIINNQRLAAAVTWLEEPKGLGSGLFPHQQTECSQNSISPTSQHQALGERAGEGGIIACILSLSKCSPVLQFPT